MMQFNIITIFPKIFESYFNESIIKRAQENGKIKIDITNLRNFAKGKHKTTDEKPYGGGAGMVLMAEPILKAVNNIIGKRTNKSKNKIVVLSAKGKQFNQKIAYNWSKKYDQIIFISGRYEGIDERVKTILRADEVSIGPYVLTDGDAAVMVVISAITRLIPGAIKFGSLKEESHYNLLINNEELSGGLEYPHYTRPEALEYKGKEYRVPTVLLSGDHKKIAQWRQNHKS